MAPPSSVTSGAEGWSLVVVVAIYTPSVMRAKMSVTGKSHSLLRTRIIEQKGTFWEGHPSSHICSALACAVYRGAWTMTIRHPRGAAFPLLAALLLLAVTADAFVGKKAEAAVAGGGATEEAEEAQAGGWKPAAATKTTTGDESDAAASTAAVPTPSPGGGARHLWCTEALCTPAAIEGEKTGAHPYQRDVADGVTGRGYPYWNKTDFSEEQFSRAMWEGPAAVGPSTIPARLQIGNLRSYTDHTRTYTRSLTTATGLLWRTVLGVIRRRFDCKNNVRSAQP